MTLTPGGRGLGLIPDAPDDRDHLLTVEPGATAYKFVDLEHRKATPPVWNQLALGACTAHGTLAAFMWASNKHGQHDPMLSRLQLYYNSRKLEGTVGEDSGAQIRDAIKAAGMGIAPETDWPYNIKRFAQAPPAKAATDAAQNVALKYRRVPCQTSSIQAVLTSGYPVVIGLTLYDTFESDAAFTTGFVPNPQPGDRVIGGHCMAVWGIGTGHDWHAHKQFVHARLDPAKVYCKIRNSWGPDVYQRGYLLMEADGYLSDPDLASDYWMITKVS